MTRCWRITAPGCASANMTAKAPAWLVPLVILAGALSAITQGLMRQAVLVWQGPGVAAACSKLFNGTDENPAWSFHLVKNVGQEWAEATIKAEAAAGTDLGKLAYKVASLLICAALFAGVALGAILGAILVALI